MGARSTWTVEGLNVGDHATIARTMARPTAVSTGTAEAPAARAKAFSSFQVEQAVFQGGLEALRQLDAG